MRLKDNMLIRGIYYLYKDYFSINRKKLGFCGPNVTLTPPLRISNPENVFYMEITDLIMSILQQRMQNLSCTHIQALLKV